MKLHQITVAESITIKAAMRIIDKFDCGMVVVLDDGKLKGLTTIGDLRRAIFKGAHVEETIEKYLNTNPTVAHLSKLKDEEYLKELVERCARYKIHYVPILDDDNNIIYLSSLENLNAGRISQELNERKEKTVLVVGGAGYVGSHISRKLIKQGFKVRVLDMCIFGEDAIKDLLQNENFELMKRDIRDITVINDAIENVDAVIHLAGIVGDPATSVIPRDSMEINLLATRALADACKFNQINRFVFASTCSVYGIGEDVLTEESAPNPISLYSRLKLQIEEMLMEMSDENFSPTILRLSTLYGPSERMRFDLVVNLLTGKAVFENKVTIFGGKQWRPFLHVEDAAEAFIEMVKSPIEKVASQIFNIGKQDENYQIIQIADFLKEHYPDLEVEYTEDEDKRDYRVDFTKVKEHLNYEPQRNLKDGIKEIIKLIEKTSITDYNTTKYSNRKTLI